ncbi:MAG: GntR family transcriptional regulator [Leadbetterella sp.]
MDKKKSKEEVYTQIKDYILSFEITPGQNITENAISEQLGIGRTPVREALTKLESEGLIVNSKGRKSVHSLSFDEIKEIFDIKAVLEGAVANWASQRGSAKEKQQLESILNEMTELAKNRPEETKQRDSFLKKWLEIDSKMHKIIFKMANCKKVEEIIKKLNLQWHRTRISVYALEGRTARSAKEHEKFVLHIIKGEGDKAESAMKAHLKNLTDEIEDVMKLFNYPTR